MKFFPLVFLLGFPLFAGAEGLPVDVFTSGKDGYHSYRIPSLIMAPNGDLLVFCEGRKVNRHDDGDIDLIQKRSKDGGKTWGPNTILYEEGGDARIKYGNPTAVVDRETGVIWLAVNRDYLTEKGARAGGSLVLFRSSNNGSSWSDPIDITSSIKQPDWGHYAFGPGIGIQIQHGDHGGRLLFPANYRKSFDKRKPSWSHVILSDDHGKTWRMGGQLGDFTNECQVAEILENGQSVLLFNTRNHWGRGGFPDKSGNRIVARSRDGGISWQEEKMDPALPDPPCQASLFRYSFPTEDGKHGHLLFCNPAGPGRSHLTLRLSRDEGRTWPKHLLVDPGSAAYSCLCRLGKGDLGIIYEGRNYGRISFARISREWILQ